MSQRHIKLSELRVHLNDAGQLVLVVQSEDDAETNSVKTTLKISEIEIVDNVDSSPSLTVLKVIEE